MDNIFDIIKNGISSYDLIFFTLLLSTLSISFTLSILSILLTLSTLSTLLELFAIILDGLPITISY